MPTIVSAAVELQETRSAYDDRHLIPADATEVTVAVLENDRPRHNRSTGVNGVFLIEERGYTSPRGEAPYFDRNIGNRSKNHTHFHTSTTRSKSIVGRYPAESLTQADTPLSSGASKSFNIQSQRYLFKKILNHAQNPQNTLSIQFWESFKHFQAKMGNFPIVQSHFYILDKRNNPCSAKILASHRLRRQGSFRPASSTPIQRSTRYPSSSQRRKKSRIVHR